MENRLLRSPGMSDNNRIATTVFYAASTFAGSLTSLFLHVFLVWAVFKLALGRFELVRDRRIWVLATAFALYPLAELLSVLVNQRGIVGLEEVAGQLAFFAVLPVVSRLSLTPGLEITRAAGLGAGLGGIFCLIISAVQMMFFKFGRPEAGFGNAGVLAVASLTFAVIALIALPYLVKWQTVVAKAGIACALMALLLTGMRAVWIAAPFALLIAAMPLFTATRGRLSRKSLLKVVAVGLLLLIVGSPIVFSRIMAAYTDIVHLAETAERTSLGQRFILWQAGYEFFMDRPLFGYGADAVRELTAAAFHIKGEGYSHFHNFVLTALVRGGLVELAAILAIPAATVWYVRQSPQLQIDRSAQMLLAALVVTFYMPGLFGILFDHDIMNALFVFSAIVAMSISVPRRAPQTGPASRNPR